MAASSTYSQVQKTNGRERRFGGKGLEVLWGPHPCALDLLLEGCSTVFKDQTHDHVEKKISKRVPGTGSSGGTAKLMPVGNLEVRVAHGVTDDVL